MDAHDRGRWGEEIAALHLQDRGWRILARNQRVGHKELDLVARRGALLAFVEVKTRSGPGFGHPLEAITRRKRREVVAAARGWLREHPQPGCRLRFDAVAVFLEDGRPARVEHVAGAWRIGE